MSAFLYSFHRGLYCLNLDDCLVENGRQLKKIASDCCGGVPVEELSVIHNGRLVTEDSKLHLQAGDVCYATLLLQGGKGGFGSMLRALGAQIEKTTNREACRDLSGRRMRDINDEKKIAEWVSKQAEREREKEKQKQERLARRRAMPKHTFDDQSYTQHIQQNSERIEDALHQGLRVAGSSTSTSSSTSVEKTTRKRVHTDEPSTSRGGKKSRLWLGMDELPDSDEEDDEFSPSESDSKAAPSSSTSTSTDASFSSTRVEPSRSPQSPEDRFMDVETETIKTAMPTSDADTEVHRCTQILETDTEMQAVTNMQALETDVDNSDHRRDRTAEENDTSLKTTRQGVEDTSNANLANSQVTEKQSLEKVEFHLDNYISAEELESLGLDRLKVELNTRGLKCGGTLQQRAQRLFATKGIPLDQLDPTFFAKPTGNNKSKVKK